MLQTLNLTDLHPHPDNPNVMPDRLFRKLVDHLRTTGRYPPLIVRPHQHAYQILDGHHRAKALQQLNIPSAQCLVWNADDAQALILLTTLNRLQGEDDPHRRGQLIRKLHQHLDPPTVARYLPEKPRQARRLVTLANPPRRVTKTPRSENLPVPVYFFLQPDQSRAVEAKLASLGGPREQALLQLLNLL